MEQARSDNMIKKSAIFKFMTDFIYQFLRHRRANPLFLLFVLRLMVEEPEFKFRLHAFVELLGEEDQTFALEPLLLKPPVTFRLPAKRAEHFDSHCIRCLFQEKKQGT